MKKAIKLSLLVIVAISFTMCTNPHKEQAQELIPKLVYVQAFTNTGASFFSVKAQVK